ncbi:MAG TPA: hypothetical protein VJS17_11335, partial [Pyrinomonadaceae bacterium]|nr:hypothetical protein [Pyrinomonadaceae bacterium]
MRDPNIPVTSQLLGVATTMKALLTDRSRSQEIHDAYVVELAAGLSKRTGSNQTTTAVTLLSITLNPTPTLNAGLREARRILVQQLDTLHPFTQEWVVRQTWDELRDPELIPVYKKMLTTTGIAAKSVREGTLTRLLEMAPADARAAVIAEIRDPESLVDPKILGALEDKFLPEVDESLLDQVRRSASSTDNRARLYLKFKAELLARFATESIYQDVIELYRSVGNKLQPDSRAGFLAYLAKHNDREALPLIEEAVAAYKPGDSPWILNDITNLYYSEAIDALLKKILETDDASQASHVAYLLGKHGAAGDERVLTARLKRWREDWRDRVAEADAQSQGQIERELIWALLNGKSWKFPPERVDELKKSCITQMCKQTNLVSQ